MDTQKQEIADRLKKANNVLVTVSNNPSVDQLAACIGLTLVLNKLDKHATAVFSGKTPSTIEFLQPEETLEKNTDSLRDFIISLDKSKADKLRYKVEDRLVRIFITPYKTSISDQDLEFSQGDFNVDVVVTLGVHEQKDLDQAITAHGRIMHDATVVTVNNQTGADLGGINWLDTAASSLSEMATSLVSLLGDNTLLDQQIATALLTGIVAETDRFSNEKTTANTMNASAALMAAGANQQLVANKLQAPTTDSISDLGDEVIGEQTKAEPEKLSEVQIAEDGTLEIDHKKAESSTAESETKELDTAVSDSQDRTSEPPKAPANYDNPRTAISTPPVTAQPAFTSAIDPQQEEKAADTLNPLNLPPVAPSEPSEPPKFDVSLPNLPPLEPPVANALTPPFPDRPTGTLQDLEQEVGSPHLGTPANAAPPASADELNLADLQQPSGLAEAQPDLAAARDAVAQAMTEQPAQAETPSAFNSTIVADNLNVEPAPPDPAVASDPGLPPIGQLPTSPDLTVPSEQPMTMPLPGTSQPANPPSSEAPQGPGAPPTVPPPIIPR